MIEYRIVCDRKTARSNGEEHIVRNVAPWLFYHSLPQYKVCTSEKEAKRILKLSISKAKEFDEKTQMELSAGKPYAVGYWQSNFRIQSREVTDWK